MKLAKRLSGICASPTIAVMQEAQRLKKQGIDVIDFGPGEPDFPTPAPIKQAGIDAINADFTKYTASSGILELRQAIADKYNREWGTDFTPANVVINSGAKHSIYSVCMAVFEDGDEVLVPAPYWVTFPEVVKMTGARPIDLITTEEQGFILEPSAVEAAIGPSTRGLIINTPNNPTGAVIPGDKIEQLAEIGRRRNLFLLFDETYEYFTYGQSKHQSLASFVKSSDDFYAIIGSVSKTYSMTGWRIGYTLGSKALIDKIGEFQSHASGNPTSVAQKAALAAINSDPALVKGMQEEYRRRREYVLGVISEIPGFSCAQPEGAFYVFPNVTGCLKASGIPDSQEFARFLIQEARVATVPGSAFGMDGYIRISYATSMDNLREGLGRIKAAVTRLLEK
ncbi:MAG TPA: pyridoxal phosphate-dependent aminotransferase [Acidobacteriota bacterium]|nr:pyridoxal phosphate-dependent aminotransferase [Acidobacteriota bacterium]